VRRGTPYCPDMLLRNLKYSLSVVRMTALSLPIVSL
jgi:hypothetical protein